MLPCPLAALATIRQTTRELLAVGGIGLMHCTGMQAMQMKAELRCDPVMFGVSITVAAVLATLALWVKFFEPISERRTPTE